MTWRAWRRESVGEGIPTERGWQSHVRQLTPVVQAELERGNVVIGSWREIARSPEEQYTELRLLYPPDTDAITAQFDLPTGVWARDGRVGSIPDQAMILGRSRPNGKRRAAQAQWWEQWVSGPQLRQPLPAPDSP